MSKNGSMQGLLEQPMNNHPSPLIIIAAEGPWFMSSAFMPSARRIEKRSDGRLEKRATVKVPVRIVNVENALIAETTTTLNISRRGARIVAIRRWQPGDEVDLASLSGGFQRLGRVIYCHALADGQFCVGLEFGATIKDWKEAPWASVA
jgi:hypothetical protein